MAIRGQFTINGRSFAVADSAFLEVFSTGTSTVRGTVSNDGLPVTMAASPQQLILASGGIAYLLNLDTNAFSAIAGSTFSGPVSQVAICTDFFLVLVKNSKEFAVSAALDATDWTSNGTAIVDVFPDNIVSMIVVNNQIWFYSDTQRAVYFESGNTFPFDYIQGSFGETGSAAQFAVVKMAGTILWLGRNERGQGTVLRAYGYNEQRVSNYAVEFAIQGYERIDDAIAFGYQDQGHNFYVIYFPTPSKTWVYDTDMNMWHERGFWLTSIAQFKAAHYQNHTFNFGKHLVGDWQSNNIYEMHIPVYANATWTFADDDGNPIRRVRRAAHISMEQKKQFFSRMQVYLESGLGPVPPFQGVAPATVITLQDSSGQLWALQVQDNGQLITGKVSSGTPQTIILEDSSRTHLFLLGILTDGRLTGSPVGTAISGTFVQANVNPLNGVWTPESTNGADFWSAHQVISNRAVPTNPVNPPSNPFGWDAISFYNAITWANDQTFTIVVGNLTNDGTNTSGLGVALRCGAAGAETDYECNILSLAGGVWEWEIGKSSGATFTELTGGTLAGPVNSGDSITGTVIGNTISLLINGTLIGSANDSDYASGAPGMVAIPDSVVTHTGVSSFTGTSLVSAGATTTSAYSMISMSGTRQYFLGVIPAGNLETFPGGGLIIARGPVVTMRYSKDSGHTWSDGVDRDCGQAGEYGKRVIWNRLGVSRDRVFEISTADPWGPRIIDGFVEYEQSEA